MIRFRVFSQHNGIMDYLAKEEGAVEYYAKDGEMPGVWQGELLDYLGLEAGRNVGKSEFADLVSGLNPATGQRLTARQGKKRRIGYDISFHAPKSVSIMGLVYQDDRLLEVFDEAVLETMQDMEKQMATRVRKGYQQSQRTTGKMAWASFRHSTSRPVAGQIDPHLHSHCFTFNATFDELEGQMKAGEFVDMKSQADLSQAVFHSRLMHKVKGLGYGVSLRDGKWWEIEQVPREMVENFSKRTRQVEALAKKLGVKNAKAKDALGALSRERKAGEMKFSELQELWQKSLDSKQKEVLDKTLGLAKYQPQIDSKLAVKRAVLDLFEKNAVVTEKELLKKSLWYGRGDVNLDSVLLELAKNDFNLLKKELGNKRYYTNHQSLFEEENLLKIASDGLGKFSPVNFDSKVLTESGLSSQQQAVVSGLLNSRDGLTLVRGGAGTGKTTSIKLAKDLAEGDGRRVWSFAPTISSSRENLRASGFEDAQTVAKLLSDSKVSGKIAKGDILWVDEAGLLDTASMKDILELAQTRSAQIWMTGDTRQHSPVLRGKGLESLEQSKILNTDLELSQIYRQKANLEYKQAVELVAEGKVKEGLQVLSEMGSVFGLNDPEERLQAISVEYVDGLSGGLEVMLVSPSHLEGREVANSIRKELKARGRLGQEDKGWQVYKPVSLSKAEKSIDMLEDGCYVKFYADELDKAGDGVDIDELVGAGRGSRGGGSDGRLSGLFGVKANTLYQVQKERVEVESGDASGFKTRYRLLNSDGQLLDFPDLGADVNCSVYREDFLPVAVGEKIRLTEGVLAKVAESKKDMQFLEKGQKFSVIGWTEDGKLELRNKDGKEFLLDSKASYFDHDYYTTSYSSQSKTVDKVIISQTSQSLPASSKNQFYVSISRGKDISIYTDDVKELVEMADRMPEDLRALELMEKGVNVNPKAVNNLHLDYSSDDWGKGGNDLDSNWALNLKEGFSGAVVKPGVEVLAESVVESLVEADKTSNPKHNQEKPAQDTSSASKKVAQNQKSVYPERMPLGIPNNDSFKKGAANLEKLKKQVSLDSQANPNQLSPEEKEKQELARQVMESVYPSPVEIDSERQRLIDEVMKPEESKPLTEEDRYFIEEILNEHRAGGYLNYHTDNQEGREVGLGMEMGLDDD